MDTDEIIAAATRSIGGEDAYIETTVVVLRNGARIDVQIRDRGRTVATPKRQYSATIPLPDGQYAEGDGASPDEAIRAAWDSSHGYFDR